MCNCITFLYFLNTRCNRSGTKKVLNNIKPSQTTECLIGEDSVGIVCSQLLSFNPVRGIFKMQLSLLLMN